MANPNDDAGYDNFNELLRLWMKTVIEKGLGDKEPVIAIREDSEVMEFVIRVKKNTTH